MAAEQQVFWQSRQSRSAEEELHIFGSPGRDEMWKWTFTSLEVLVEQVRKRNLRSFEVLAEQKFEKRNFTYLAVKAERKCGSEPQTFRSPGRAEVRKLNFRSLAVKAGRKCASGTSHLWKNWQSRSADQNSCHIMGSQCRAEMQKRKFTSQVVQAVRKLSLRSLAVNAERKCGSGTSDL